MNNHERGYAYLIISFILCITNYILLYAIGFIYEFFNNLNSIDYGFSLLAEKYMFYGCIIFGLLGYTYIYGEPEKDFYRYVAIPSMILFIIMDLRGVFNLLGMLIV